MAELPIYQEGMFSKVFFEVREENVPSAAKLESVRMFEKRGKDEAKVIGKMTYAVHADLKVELQGFHMENWDEKERYASRFIKWFLWFARKKRKATQIVGGIFSTDTRTGEKLEAFRSHGFSVKEMGSMAGHSEYQLEYQF